MDKREVIDIIREAIKRDPSFQEELKEFVGDINCACDCTFNSDTDELDNRVEELEQKFKRLKEI